jgi:hypothetical protein
MYYLLYTPYCSEVHEIQLDLILSIGKATDGNSWKIIKNYAN